MERMAKEESTVKKKRTGELNYLDSLANWQSFAVSPRLLSSLWSPVTYIALVPFYYFFSYCPIYHYFLFSSYCYFLLLSCSSSLPFDILISCDCILILYSSVQYNLFSCEDPCVMHYSLTTSDTSLYSFATSDASLFRIMQYSFATSDASLFPNE